MVDSPLRTWQRRCRRFPFRRVRRFPRRRSQRKEGPQLEPTQGSRAPLRRPWTGCYRSGLVLYSLVVRAVFAGVVRAPITSVLIIFEMTGSYGLILPLMIANMSAYALARHYRPTPIYEALIEQDGIRDSQWSDSLTDPEVYALTAYLLSLNGIIGKDDVMDAATLPKVQMPNRGNFIMAYPDRRGPR